MKIETFELPAYWASALINGDMSGYEDSEIAQIDAFTDSVVAEFGQCWALSCDGQESDFRRYHDATRFGVLACDVETFSFDVTPR